MRVRVDACVGHGHHFRLTLPNGVRLIIPSKDGCWRRGEAIRAKDLIVVETGVARNKIYFY